MAHVCGCGRSPNGFCNGSHAMSESMWREHQKKLAQDQFLSENKDDDIDDTHNVSDQGG